jgi:hypothetical protein
LFAEGWREAALLRVYEKASNGKMFVRQRSEGERVLNTGSKGRLQGSRVV